MGTKTLARVYDDLVKTAKTRRAREAEAAFKAHDTDYLKQLGAAGDTLGLAPREAANVGQGAEGMTQLMLGGHKDLPAGDPLHIRKTYDPASIISQGSATSALLQDKIEATRAMQEAAAAQGGHVAIPAMGGVTVKNEGIPGMMRHQSVHEFVPGISSYQTNGIPLFPIMNPGLTTGPDGGRSYVNQAVDALKEGRLRDAWGHGKATLTRMSEAPLERVSNVLQAAQKKTGKTISDAVGHRYSFGAAHTINSGNVVNAGGTPTVLDVIPVSKRLSADQMARIKGRMGDAIRQVGGLADEASAGAFMKNIPATLANLGMAAPTDSRTIQREFYNPQVAMGGAAAAATLGDSWRALKKIPLFARAAMHGA